MISFITLTRTPCLPGPLHSIELMKLPRWEFLPVDGTKHDLPTGYNLGASRAEGDVMVFVHDDVRFMCNGENFEAQMGWATAAGGGFVGIAGSRRLDYRGAWWVTGDARRGMCAHPTEGGGGTTGDGVHVNVWPGPVALFGQVLVLDGVLLACSRATFDKLGGFDEGLPGFHFYDLDITLRAHLAGLKNYAKCIPVFHGSRGDTSQGWGEAKTAFIAKHRDSLPVTILS